MPGFCSGDVSGCLPDGMPPSRIILLTRDSNACWLSEGLPSNLDAATELVVAIISRKHDDDGCSIRIDIACIEKTS